MRSQFCFYYSFRFVGKMGERRQKRKRFSDSHLIKIFHPRFHGNVKRRNPPKCLDRFTKRDRSGEEKLDAA